MSDHAAVGVTRIACACVLLVVVPLGLASKLYAGPGAGWVTGSAGGFLYVLFWIFLLLLVAPRISVSRLAVGVLAVTSLVELLQLWHSPLLESARSTFVGHALLGSTFSWTDFVYYALAAVAAPALARLARAWTARRRWPGTPADAPPRPKGPLR